MQLDIEKCNFILTNPLDREKALFIRHTDGRFDVFLRDPSFASSSKSTPMEWRMKSTPDPDLSAP